MTIVARKNDAMLQPINDSSQKAAIINAVSAYDVTDDNSVWSELDKLSNRTEFDGLEAVPEGIFSVGDSGFEAVATIYVILNYGNGSDDVRAPETFSANVRGHIDENTNVIIDNVDIDTTAFYS